MSELDDVLHRGNKRIKDYQQAEIARLTAALDEAKRGLERIAERGTSQIPVKHPRRGEQPAYTTYRAVENEYAQIARETLSTIERGSDEGEHRCDDPHCFTCHPGEDG